MLQQFKDGEQPLLIATDVAQRGLDIKGVAHVVNYDCPTTGEAYVVFSNAVQMDFALQKNRAGMGRRYIEVFRSKKAEYYHAVAAAVAEAQTNGGAGAFASARDARADATAALAETRGLRLFHD